MNDEGTANRTPASVPSTDEVKKAIGVAAPSVLRRVFVLICGISLIGAIVFLFQTWRLREANSDPIYEEAEVKRGDLQVTVRATGTLQAITTVEVGAEVTGRVLTVRVDANDLVKKGQVLAEIDPEQLRAAVDQVVAQVAAADAAILQAKATVTEATLDLNRTRHLGGKGIASQSELDKAIATKERADANLASAVANAALTSAALKSARSRLDKATIISPVDGIVLSRLVEPGQTVTAGFQTPVLFKLAQDLTQMRLNVDVDEADVGRVRDGLEAVFTVEAYPDRKFPSRVLSLHNEPKTSQNVVTYQAVLTVDNTERLLRPGMTCTATIISETKHDVLLVPNVALRFTPPSKKPKRDEKKAGVEGEQKQHVWVLRGDMPVAIEVRAGLSDGFVTEILAGDLKPGTKVLTDVKEPR
jgi:HlyD family secretion protein